MRLQKNMFLLFHLYRYSHRYRVPQCLCLLFCCCLISGCGSSKPHDIQVVITLDDEPLAEAEVFLFSMLGSTPSATGTTNAEGEVAFKTKEMDGVLPGSYTMVVSKMVDEKRLSNDEIRALAEIGIQYRTQRIELVPPKYTQRETTDLTLKVGRWRTKELTFDLRSRKTSP